MSEQNKQLAREGWKCIEEGRFDDLAKVYHPDVRYHGAGGDERQGVEAMIELGRMYKTAFPDMKTPVEHLVAEGDYVVSRVNPSGTHKAELMGIPPTGKTIDIKWVMSMVRIQDGKIVEEWEVFDSGDLMRQLGVV